MRALHRRLWPWTTAPRLALAGSLLAPGGPLRDATLAALAPELDLQPLDHPLDAARGAAGLARRAAAAR